MGGTVAVSYALAHQDRLSGLILSGPLAAIDPVGAPTRLAATALSKLAPRAPAVAVDSSLVSRDPAVVEDYRRDPLVHHGKLPVRTVAELAAAIEAFPDRVGAIQVPTLILYGTEDGLCPPRGSEMLAERIGSTEITARSYAGLYHEILNEPEREQVLDDICAWLAARVGARRLTSVSIQTLAQGEPAAAEVVAAGRDQIADELRQLVVGGARSGGDHGRGDPVAGPLDR